MTTQTSLINDPDFSGAVVGVVGAGGSLPTNWTFDGGRTPTITVVSLTTTGGRRVMQLRVQLASGTSTDFKIYTGQVAASVGQQHYAGTYAKIISGGGPSYQNAGIYYFNSGGSYVGDVDVGFYDNSANINPLGTGTAPTNTAKATLAYAFVVPATTAIDMTIDISQPMLVLGSWMPPYIGGSGAGPFSADVTTTTITATGAGSVTIPSGVTEWVEEGWGGGGSAAASTNAEAGGGSGAFARTRMTGVAGDIVYYNVSQGQQGSGTTAPSNTWAHTNTNSATSAELVAKSASANTAGTAAASTGDVKWGGATGRAAQGTTTGSRAGSGGSSSGSPAGAGSQGTAGSSNVSGAGAAGGTDKGGGGAGGVSTANGADGSQPGGGAGGGGNVGGNAGKGGDGQFRLSYLTPTSTAVPRSFASIIG